MLTIEFVKRFNFNSNSTFYCRIIFIISFNCYAHAWTWYMNWCWSSRRNFELFIFLMNLWRVFVDFFQDIASAWKGLEHAEKGFEEWLLSELQRCVCIKDINLIKCRNFSWWIWLKSMKILALILHNYCLCSVNLI